MNDNEFYVAVWRVIGAIIVMLSLTIGGCHSYQTKIYIENGYTKTTLPGWSDAVWVKP